MSGVCGRNLAAYSEFDGGGLGDVWTGEGCVGPEIGAVVEGVAYWGLVCGA